MPQIRFIACGKTSRQLVVGSRQSTAPPEKVSQKQTADTRFTKSTRNLPLPAGRLTSRNSQLFSPCNPWQQYVIFTAS